MKTSKIASSLLLKAKPYSLSTNIKEVNLTVTAAAAALAVKRNSEWTIQLNQCSWRRRTLGCGVIESRVKRYHLWLHQLHLSRPLLMEARQLLLRCHVNTTLRNPATQTRHFIYITPQTHMLVIDGCEVNLNISLLDFWQPVGWITHT